jgi:hypothetical protein
MGMVGMKHAHVRTLLFAALAAAALPALAAGNDRIRIANEGQIGDQWSLVPGTQLMPPYPEAYAKDPEQVCMVIGYLVNADGTTSDFALLKSWASGSNARSRGDFWGDFADLASRAVAQWRYSPKDPASAKPVYTSTTFVFGNVDDALETKTHCEVADLSDRLAELRYDGRAGRMMSQGIFGQLDIDPYVDERRRQQAIAQREMDDKIRETNAVRENNQSQMTEHVDRRAGR